MAFNESANTGFSADILVTWEASAMTVWSSGRITAAIGASYGGPSVAAEEQRDVLFWGVSAVYTFGPYGDTAPVSLAGPTGVLALQDASSPSPSGVASFAIDGPFLVPPLRDANDETLVYVEIDWTWVRVFRTSGALTFQVLPAGVIGHPAPIVWDRPSPPVEGRFAYYVPFSESVIAPDASVEFDYQTWIRANVTW
jgi:hypothetical protein